MGIMMVAVGGLSMLLPSLRWITLLHTSSGEREGVNAMSWCIKRKRSQIKAEKGTFEKNVCRIKELVHNETGVPEPIVEAASGGPRNEEWIVKRSLGEDYN